MHDVLKDYVRFLRDSADSYDRAEQKARDVLANNTIRSGG